MTVGASILGDYVQNTKTGRLGGSRAGPRKKEILMSRSLTVVALSAAICLPAIATADWEKGVTAFTSRDFKTAVEEFQELVEYTTRRAGARFCRRAARRFRFRRGWGSSQPVRPGGSNARGCRSDGLSRIPIFSPLSEIPGRSR